MVGDGPHPTALAELEAATMGDPKADRRDLPPAPGVFRAPRGETGQAYIYHPLRFQGGPLTHPDEWARP